VVKETQRAAPRVEIPNAGICRLGLVFIPLRIKVAGTVARPIAGKEDGVVGPVNGRDVIVVLGLEGNLFDNGHL
jgi:hypothetical protein